jgi:hypothetical protein
VSSFGLMALGLVSGEIVKLAASLIAILFLAGLARWLNLGGDVRIRDEDHARAIARDTICDFEAVDLVLDRARIGALLRDAGGRQMLIRRHGVQFVGRLLSPGIEARLDQNFLTLGVGDKFFGTVTLNLGDQAQIWASGLRHLRV